MIAQILSNLKFAFVILATAAGSVLIAGVLFCIVVAAFMLMGEGFGKIFP